MDELEKIKKEIENTGAALPEGLSKENIVKMLDEKGIKPAAKIKTFNRNRVLGMVAALVIVVAAVAVGLGSDGEISTDKTAQQTTAVTSADTTEQKTKNANEYKEIEKYFLSIRQEMKKYYAADGDDVQLKSATANFDGAAAESYTVAAAETAAGMNGTTDGAPTVDNTQSYGKTNTQVDGVDEADVIKNDGTYIYNRTDGSTINITDTRTMSVASSIEIKSENEKENLYVQELYVTGDKLIVICTKNIYSGEQYNGVYEKSVYLTYGATDMQCLIYDIADRTNPKLLRSFSQNGSYNSSRLVGTVLYNISTYNVDTGADEVELKDKCIPYVDGKRIDSANIIWERDGDEDTTAYVVVTAFDLSHTDSQVESISLLGYCNEIYCTDSALFVSELRWDEDKQYTDILAFGLNGTQLTYKTKGSVPGTPLNQFSLDEYNGYFRIVTTAYSYEDFIDVSSIYVLDGDMNIVGRLENLKYDESVRSVRFMGNTAYVVTFKNTDPLFVIDLSNPTQPTVSGEVKLPGFSAYLHPVGDGLVVGVGYNGDDENADYESVKVSLFNVKNPQNPVEINNVVIECATTEINYVPKAFMYYAEKGYIGIPLQIYKNEAYVNSFMVLKVTDSGIEKVHGFVHQTGDDVWGNAYFRGTYIGEKLFTVSDKLINGFSLESYEKIGTVSLHGFEYGENYAEYNWIAVDETVKAETK